MNHLNTFVVALLAAQLAAQTPTPSTVVLPDESYATSAGSTGIANWGRTSASAGSVRFQMVYDGSMLTAQGIGEPVWIQRMRFRERAGWAENDGLNATQTTVRMSTASTGYQATSAVFGDNHGDDVTTVFAGTPSYTASTGSTPTNNWSIEVTLDTPFFYDPAAGGLVIDIDRAVANGSWFYEDANFATGANQPDACALVSTDNGAATGATSGQVVLHLALVCELTVEPFTPPTPDLLCYQFNEVRGNELVNTATSSTFPTIGTANQVGWQTDSDRPRFRGNEAGFGALSYSSGEEGPTVAAGAPLQHNGDITFMWWQRRQEEPNFIIDAMGGGNLTQGNFLAAGVTGDPRLYYSSRFGTTDRMYQCDQILGGAIGEWQHVCVVIDNQALAGHFYVDGVNSSSFSFQQEGPHTCPPMQGFHVGSAGYPWVGQTRRFDMDDARVYGSALTPQEVYFIAKYGSERASAGATGTSCSSWVGAPGIGPTGGLPTSGNAAFGVELDNLVTTAPVMILLGLTPASAPMINLDFLLGGPNCLLQVPPIAWSFGVPSAGTFSMSLPIPSGFAGSHVYAQGLQNAGGVGSMTKLLDINIQDR